MINNVTVLVDNDSWILPYAFKLITHLNAYGKNATLARSHADVAKGDVCFLLGCTRIVDKVFLSKNKHNLVVHESGLPKGKGFAPVAWQILEGKNEIPVCLIEVGNEVDSGDIILTDVMRLSGTELLTEWRELQGNISIGLALKFILEYPAMKAIKQSGLSTSYPRRHPSDSKIDLDKRVRDIIPLLRVVDNCDYPAFFEYKGCKYRLEISKYE
jgi:methionyl-tRNA formyltransferase